MGWMASSGLSALNVTAIPLHRIREAMTASIWLRTLCASAQVCPPRVRDAGRLVGQRVIRRLKRRSEPSRRDDLRGKRPQKGAGTSV
jgi:hypothetical protein